MAMREQQLLSTSQENELLKVLKERFEKNKKRHTEIDWTSVELKLKAAHEKLWSLAEMERTGGEPDVVGHDSSTGGYLFFDCASESPAGRRSLCYDREALDLRKENKPRGSVIDMAAAMGVSLLTEVQYRQLHHLGEFDAKTSSWIETPAAIRSRGGALFCDFRYGQVFVYHNGASSYYAARGFRAALWV